MMMSSVTYSSVKYDEKILYFTLLPSSYMSKKMEQRESFFLRVPCWGFIPPFHSKNKQTKPSIQPEFDKQNNNKQTNNKQLEYI